MSSRQLDEEAIFQVARKIPDLDARLQYLEQVCASDQAQRERVEALLAVHEEEQGFLKSKGNVEPTVDQSPLTERPGITIGRYKLMEQLGEGGMGVVFVAEQERPIRRKVALKVIKPGMDSKAVVARFEAERQALAMMDHSNIAKVLDAGTTASGRPYFAMELVKGIPITEYCDKNKLAIRERLELFTQVCQAIQHAHQKSIIHRDIKPSNVLVTLHDGRPVPKVIDFGVAKALNARLTDKTIYTEHLQIVGTLLYMSPEQAELSGLDVDTRSDVYSLGVLLYELLTGTTPFQKAELDQAAFDEQRRIIREQDPPRASIRISSLGQTATSVAEHRHTDVKKLQQLVRGDLDWIVARALEKDRTRRYGMACSLADDINRFLLDEPIEARPPSAVYVLRKLASRHSIALATSAVVATTLVVGIAITTQLAIVAKREKTTAIEARNRAVTAEKEVRSTLRRLQDEVYDRALSEALLGGANAEALIQQSEVLEIGEPKLNVLRGLQAFYRGELQKAIRLLERGERSVAARAVLAWSFSVAGDHQKFAETSIELKTLECSSATDLLLLGQLHSAVVPEKALPIIEKGLQLRESSVLGHTIYALALANDAMNNVDMHLAQRAIDEVHACRTFRPESTFVLSAYLHAHSVASQIAQLEGDDAAASRFFAEAEKAASSLGRLGNRYVMYDRAGFLSLAGRVDEAMMAWKDCMQSGGTGFTPMVFAPFACLHNRSDEAIEELQAYAAKNDTFARLAIAFLKARDPVHRDDVVHTYHEIVRRFKDCDTRMFALHLLLMSQQPDKAEVEARKLVESSQELILPYMAHIRFIAGGSADDLLKASPNLGHFDIALKAFSNGDRVKARHHFEKCARGNFLFAQNWWSRVYLTEMAKEAAAN